MPQKMQPIDITMGWAHDIRTHLYIIKGAIGMMQSEKLTPEQSKEYTEMIRHNVSSMERLVNHLLQDTNEKKALCPNFGLMEINGLLCRVIHHVKPFAASRRVDLVYDIEDGLRICGDSEMLERVLVNIMTNAVKCTEEKGVVYLHAQKSGEGVRVAISDTGCGFSKEQLEQLRGGPDQAVGEGYGLKLVKSLIAAMNAQMECNSQPNVGTTFSFYLPQREAAPELLCSNADACVG